MRHFPGNICLLLTLTIGIISCQPEINDPGPTEPIIADSTHLIKSIMMEQFEPDGVTLDRRLIEQYDYDTVNRKIYLSWIDTDPLFNGTKSELSYDPSGMLIHVKHTYPQNFPLEDADSKEVWFTYDAEDVLQEMRQLMGDGTTRITTYTKSPHPDGYRLRWESIGYAENFINQAIYDNTGRLLHDTATFTASNHWPLGTKLVDNYDYGLDGGLISGSGYVDRPDQAPSPEKLWLEISERYTKGNNLSQQRRLILGKGLSGSNFLYDDYAPGVSVLGEMTLLDPFMYTPTPVKNGKDQPGSSGPMVPFSAQAVIDSLDRLRSYRTVAFDFDHLPIVLTVTYYK